MIDTQKYIRKPLYVDAVRITIANFDEIAEWCQGEILEANNKRCIKVRVHNPKNIRQTQAFVGDWLLYTERGYKVYTNKAFHASFDLVNVETGAPMTQLEKEQREIERLDAPLSEDEEVEIMEQEFQDEPQPEVAVADGSTTPPVPQDKIVISEEEQAEMDPETIRELIQSGDYILAQDLAA